MKYEEPSITVILLEKKNIITASGGGPLIPGTDTGDDRFDAND